MGCLVGAITVFAFFAYLLHFAEDMATEAKTARSPEPAATAMESTETIKELPAISDPEEEAITADIINATRLSSLLSASRRYADDHNGQLPPMDSPKSLRNALFPDYVTGEGVFQLPGGNRAYLPNPALSGRPLKSFPDPRQIIAFYEPLSAPETERKARRAVLFLDGDLRMVTPPEWASLQKRAGLP